MIKSTTYKKYRVLFHILFWSFQIGMNTIIWGGYTCKYFGEFVSASAYVPLKIVLSYFLIYYLIPEYLNKKQYTKFFVWFIIPFFSFVLLQRGIHYYLIYEHFFPQYNANTSLLYYPKLLKIMMELLYVTALVATIKLIKQWYKDQQLNEDLKRQKLEAELKFLKAQIHPHFLFNTLNNLYALTLKKSDDAPNIVLKLSNMLDYMLYEANDRFVALEKEVECVKNYIELEKIRYGKQAAITLNVSDFNKNTKIAPMIIIPFVENAFKHGISKSQIENAYVNIDISIKENKLILNVENSFDESINNDKSGYSEGIGLNNVKRRLELLYPNKHSLNINSNKSTFSIKLQLET